MSAGDGETVTLTIDGQEITVEKGTLVIRAAEQLGIVIPRFCDHPLLDPAGACRQCIVEVEGQAKPMTSCTTECMDEMVVSTHLTSELAEDAQEAQLEFLLINHPLDCPMCDKGGECPLQDQALAHGPGMSRFVEMKRRYEKPVAVSPNVLLDRERCVLCARCTRFASQISGDPFIELFERGALQQVAIFEDEPYWSYFSGNVIQICPVGALTSASYRFRARPFDLRSSPGVCNLCSAGCNLNVHTRSGGVMRVMARDNMAVNEAWNCDKGRFAFKYLDHDLRLTRPARRGPHPEADGGDDPARSALFATSWDEAIATAAEALRATRPGRVAVLTGGRIPDEDAWALSRYARWVLGTDDVDSRTWAAGPDEDDALAVVASRDGATYEDVEAAPITLLVGLDPEEEVPILYLRLRKAWLKRDARVVTVGPRAGTVDEIAWRQLTTAPGGEAAVLDRLADALDGDGDDDRPVADVARGLGDAVGRCVILVGERGGREPGVLAAAGRLAARLGANVSWVPRRNNARGAVDAGLVPGLLPGGRRLDDEADRDEVADLWGPLPTRRGRSTAEVLEAAARGGIDVLHLVGVDLARDFDRPALATAALERTPTVIVQDLLDNATVTHADLVLPATAHYERDGTFTDWEGRAQRFRAAIDPPRLALDDWDILTRLADAVGRDLGYRSLDDIRAEMSRLPRRDPRAWSAPDASGGAGGRRSGGSSEGAGPAGDRRGRSGATPAQAGTDAGAEVHGDGLTLVTYPLLLDLGIMSVGADEMLATAKEPFAALHPEDAERHGVRDGEPVLLRSPHAELTVTAAVDPGTARGCVFVPRNSTRSPATALAGREDGRVRVSLEPVDAQVASMFGGGGR